MFSPLKLLLILSTLVAVSRSQDVRVENFELADEIATNCDTVIEASRFEGDCCSLNVTQGGGCVVNIINGRCKITGQYWSIDWTSTYSAGGAKCPPSEYAYLAPAADPPTAAPVAPADESSSALFAPSMILFAIAAGFVAIAL